MSISSEDTKLQVTLTSAIQVVPVPFYFAATADLKVVTAANVTLVEGVDYSVAGAGNTAGGSITTIPTVGNGLIIGSKLAILRIGAYDQQTSLSNLGSYPSSTVERVFDYLTTLIQQVKELAGRGIHLNDYDLGGTNMELPIPASRANKFVGFDSTGAMVMKDASSVTGSAIIESNLTLSVNVTKPGATAGAAVVFDSANAPSVTLTEGTWILNGGVTARTSDTADKIWAQFYNVTAAAPFGGGPVSYNNLQREGLIVNGSLTVAAGTTRVVCFKVFVDTHTLDVGAALGPSGYIIAHRIPV
jgi:hypothetical protein